LDKDALRAILQTLDREVHKVDDRVYLRLGILGFTCFNLDDPLTRLSGINKNFPEPYHLMVEQSGLHVIYKLILRLPSDYETRITKIDYVLTNIEAYTIHPLDVFFTKLSTMKSYDVAGLRTFLEQNNLNENLIKDSIVSWAKQYKSMSEFALEVYADIYGRGIQL
jgi:hypothetical protein